MSGQVSPDQGRKDPSTMAPITPTQLPENSRIKTNQQGNVTGGLKKTQCIALIEERDQHKKALNEAGTVVCEANQTSLGLTKQIENLTHTNADHHKDIQDKNGKIHDLNELLKTRTEELEAANKVVNTQAEAITKLEEALQDAVKSLKDAGKYAKSEQSKDIKKKVWENIKARQYRTVKFVRGEELTGLAKAVYAEIKDSITDSAGNKMIESEFLRIYESFVQEAMSGRRQCTQTQLQDAMVGKSLQCV